MTNDKVYVLIDCNNFFVSCERLFRPDLENKPVVVLSSGDGCVVARSNESKKLGVPMGAPAFKYRQLFQEQHITQFSANFELYGDISKRITALLTTITPRIEIYSVDESFLDITELGITDYEAWGRMVKTEISRHVGVPVSVGIAPSKTLAKLASEIAKQRQAYAGACSFINLSPEKRETLLAGVPVGEIWGVGWRLSPKLRAEGAGSALALANMSPQRAQQIMGIRGRQMVSELNGVACFPFQAEGALAKSIMRSRTFGEDTSEEHVLEAAIATLGARAGHQLRTHHLLARRIGLFTSSNKHKPGYRRWTREVHLDTPTNDSGQIIRLLVDELASIFSSKQRYHRMGIFLHDFVSESALQTDLLGLVDTDRHDRAKARMQAVDTINDKWGRGKIYYAAEDLSAVWQPKQKIRSPGYVSNWNELPIARITTDNPYI